MPLREQRPQRRARYHAQRQAGLHPGNALHGIFPRAVCRQGKGDGQHAGTGETGEHPACQPPLEAIDQAGGDGGGPEQQGGGQHDPHPAEAIREAAEQGGDQRQRQAVGGDKQRDPLGLDPQLPTYGGQQGAQHQLIGTHQKRNKKEQYFQ